jgi:hypothetical protein
MAGKPADLVAQELAGRIRKMGVSPNTREVAQYASRISAISAES